MATTSNPLLQPGDAVWVVLKKDGEVPLQDGGTMFYAIVKEVTWDEKVNQYRYRVVNENYNEWVSEAAYNAATAPCISKTYNTARTAFRATVDIVHP